MRHNFERDIAHPGALVSPFLLLLLAEDPGHAYELMQRLKPLGFDWSGPGPVYRQLRTLESAGMVASAWSVPQAGPMPRVYELTGDGREALDRCAANVVELAGLLNQFLGRHSTL